MKNSFILLLLFSASSYAQSSLDTILKVLNTESIPYISVEELTENEKNIVLLDAREKEEFEISHIEGAVFVGYDNFSLKKALKKLPDKNAFIVVYCSLGVRSEDIAEKLKKAGYTGVLNLYGGIFEWKNQGNKVVDQFNNPTEKVHAFSKIWAQYLKKAEKVYE